jgi:hypothetical protein
MGSLIAELLAPAVVVAIGPTQIIAVVLLLLSRRAAANSLMFLCGWLVGLTAVSAIALIIEVPLLDAADGYAATVGAILQVIVGLGLIGLAVRQWLSRPTGDEPAKLPDWMASIESVRPSKALSIGLLLSGPNVKVVMLTLVAMLAITEARLAGTPILAPLVIYIVVASSTVIVPVVGNLLLGERAAQALTVVRAWLEGNYAIILTVVLLIIGVVVAAKGLGTLLA